MQLKNTELANVFARRHVLQALAFSMMLSTVPALAQSDSADKPGAKADPAQMAKAELAPKSGSTAKGNFSILETKTGIELVTTVTNATPGRHGIHIHENGDCSAADASSAGGHFNPTGHKHGKPDSKTAHVGDLGNITVAANGEGTLSVSLTKRALGGFDDWKALIGKSVVLHETADDLKTDPAGASGARIACGVIEKVSTSDAH